MKDPELYINHISKCIFRIRGYTDEGRETFLSNCMIQDAVLRNLQVMAESISKFPPELQANYPEVDWKGIAGFRNRLVHDYLGGLNLERVWEFIRNDLFTLQHAILRLKAKDLL